MKRFLIVVCSFFLSYSLFAQGESYTTVAAKDAQVKKSGSKNFENLAVGEKLTGNDVIKCNPNGNASFLHSSGKIIVYNKTKEIKLSDLSSSATSNKNLAGQLLEVTNNKLNPSNKVSSNIGGVRASENVARDIFFITPRRGTILIDQYPVFIWNKTQGEKEFQLTILTEDLDVIKTVNLTDTIYQYSDKDPKLNRGETYICIVKPISSAKQSEYQTFTIASEKEAEDMKARIKETTELLSSVDDVTKNVLLGTTYEALGLYYNAFDSYKKVITLSPNEKAYRKMLADLLVKYNLIKEAQFLTGYNPADNNSK